MSKKVVISSIMLLTLSILISSNESQAMPNFARKYGAECNMCQDIALDAKKMHDAGMTTAKIREAIRDKYGKGSSSSN